MNRNPAYIISDDSITIVSNGRPFTTTSSNANFLLIKERIADEDFDGLEDLFNTGAAISGYTQGNIVVKNNAVFYKGEEVHNHVVDRILSFLREGLPYKPLVNFLDKLLANPSRRAVSELYPFLEHKNMPLTPEGNFLAYKSVRADWTDHRTGTIDNSVGALIPRMERNQVCDDANIGCSRGYHAGSLEYAQSFGGEGTHLLIVEINPADVVSIPLDCNCQKLRCSFYKVVGTFERPLSEALNTQYSPIYPTNTDAMDNEDYEDDVDYSGESYELGYSCGVADVDHNSHHNAEGTLDSMDDEDIVEDSFLDGYNQGYEERKNEIAAEEVVTFKGKLVNTKGKVAKTKGTISNTTRAKLRKAAKRQSRDASGRFI